MYPGGPPEYLAASMKNRPPMPTRKSGISLPTVSTLVTVVVARIPTMFDDGQRRDERDDDDGAPQRRLPAAGMKKPT